MPEGPSRSEMEWYRQEIIKLRSITSSCGSFLIQVIDGLPSLAKKTASASDK